MFFWVVANGDAAQVIEELAAFAEKLSGEKTPENERKKPQFVISVLKKVLCKRNRRWLLCLDTVDSAGDADVCGILDEVTAMAEPMESNGWVLVTSRGVDSRCYRTAWRTARISF